jgi:L-amino acid N-acyltransferase YncA
MPSISSAQVTVRPAEPQDAAAIVAIYNEGIEDRIATFQTRLHAPEDFTDRIGNQRYPLLVAESDGEIVGWAGVVAYTDSCEYYSQVGECMLYVQRRARRKGIGSRLLDNLADAAERRGFYKLVGKIFTTNDGSIKLVHRCGWLDVGVHRRHGRLDGEWRDVLVVERLVGDAAGST